MRTCPFKGCGQAISDSRFACPHHWHRMKAGNRHQITAIYNDYLQSRIGVEQLRRLQEAVLGDEQAEPQSTLCGGCKARIRFALTANGSRLPLDYDPVPDGNVTVNAEGFAVIIKKADLFSEKPPEGPRYKSHFATCPVQSLYRKKGKK